LLTAALQHARRKGLDALLLGLTEADPLLSVSERMPHISYASDVYTVSWDGEEGFHERVGRGIPHLELSGL